MSKRTPTSVFVGRGVVAGLAGTAVMTVFQLMVEMPVTGRAESDAPAKFAEKVLPMRRTRGRARRGLNYTAHFALGPLWGGAYGLTARAGLRGPRAVATVFATMYLGDLALNIALGLYHPSKWSARDIAVDVLDKLVQAGATGVVFDRFLDPAPGQLES